MSARLGRSLVFAVTTLALGAASLASCSQHFEERARSSAMHPVVKPEPGSPPGAQGSAGKGAEAPLTEALALRNERRDATHRDLTYASIGGKRIRLDLYLPEAQQRPAPLIIHIHGGGWRKNDKSKVQAYYFQFVKLGYALASVDYRLTSEAGEWGNESVIFPAQIHDVKGAVRWLRANANKYNIDSSRFAAWGESAGGHLAALLATSAGVERLEGRVGGNLEASSQVQVAVDYYGPIDILELAEDSLSTPTGEGNRHDLPTSFASAIVGWDGEGQGLGDIKRNLRNMSPPYPRLRELISDLSPATHVDRRDAPVFIAHGTQDPLVPMAQSERFFAALQRAGVESDFKKVHGAGHGGIDAQTHLAAIRFVSARLAPHLRIEAGDITVGR